MNKLKYLGIWMDNSTAHLIEFTNNHTVSRDTNSPDLDSEPEHQFTKIENLLLLKDQYDQLNHYKKLGEIIKIFDRVLLFGRTEAKLELYNYIIAEKAFEKILIDVRNTVDLNKKEQFNFVKNYFGNPDNKTTEILQPI